MGDFDKNQAPDVTAANEKKKLLMVGVLGVVLLSMVGFRFLRGGPETVSAGVQTGADGQPIAAPMEETPAQALAALERDPTAKLLTGVVSDGMLTDVPRDPFRMSDKWKSMLVKAPGPVTRQVASDPIDTRPRTVNRAAQAIAADTLKVEGIFRRGQQLSAMVNGSIVSAGMTVGSARVVEIQEDRILVRHVDWPDGPITAIAYQLKGK